MVAMMMLAAALSAQLGSHGHVRSLEARIQSLLDAGVSRSAMFRQLVDRLNRSDVIVYVEPKLTRARLARFLKHDLVAQGGYRYLRIEIESGGPEERVLPILAHELQHAVEVAQVPSVRDAQQLTQLFDRLAVTFGCEGRYSETRAAIHVQDVVSGELKARR